ncbi:MAG: YibE/F family protein, partial [Finegoldia magna]|nr:YibE/F family protein [Finegoldia magna]
ILNSKIFAQEFISILLGGIAVALSIPITAWVSARLIKYHQLKQTDHHITTSSLNEDIK